MPRLTGSAPRRLARLTPVAPGLGLAVLAKFSCAMCLTVYAGVLSSLGLSFVATDRGLMTLTLFFLVLGTASIAWSSRRHRNWGPLLVALAGAALVLLGRHWMVDSQLYAGTTLVAVAALWNLWLGRAPAPELVRLSGRSVGDRSH